MKKIFAIMLALCVVLSLASCGGIFSDGDETVSEEQSLDNKFPEDNDEEDIIISDDRAPDFTVVDANGDLVKLSDFFGKPIVMNFWASDCPPCISEMPDFQAAYEEYGDEVVFVMVNCPWFFNKTVENEKAFLAEKGYTFPVYYDTYQFAAQAYGIRSIPQTFFLNESGEVVTYAQGMISEAVLEQGIGMILD